MRVSLLMASSVLQGASVGPLIELAIEIDPRYITSSFNIHILELKNPSNYFWYLGIKWHFVVLMYLCWSLELQHSGECICGNCDRLCLFFGSSHVG